MVVGSTESVRVLVMVVEMVRKRPAEAAWTGVVVGADIGVGC